MFTCNFVVHDTFFTAHKMEIFILKGNILRFFTFNFGLHCHFFEICRGHILGSRSICQCSRVLYIIWQKCFEMTIFNMKHMLRNLAVSICTVSKSCFFFHFTSYLGPTVSKSRCFVYRRKTCILKIPTPVPVEVKLFLQIGVQKKCLYCL